MRHVHDYLIAPVPSEVSAWKIVNRTSLVGSESPSSSSESPALATSDYIIPPSEPETVPHLRVLNYSYKSKVSSDEKGEVRSRTKINMVNSF